MPLDSAAFVIVGLTNGPGFVANPCLADQVAWVQAQHRWLGAYSMTTFPDRAARATYGWNGPWAVDTRRGRLRNAGYAQALFNVTSMQGAGVDVPFVWVDVEPYPTHPWSGRPRANRAVVAGVVRGYEDSGYRVGFYSYAGGWRAVVGDWRKPRLPDVVPRGRRAGRLPRGAPPVPAAELLRRAGAARAVGRRRPGPQRDLCPPAREGRAAAPAHPVARHDAAPG